MFRTTDRFRAIDFCRELRSLGYTLDTDWKHGDNLKPGTFRTSTYTERRPGREDCIFRVTYFKSEAVPHPQRSRPTNRSRCCRPGCGKLVKGYGRCGTHYDRWKYRTDAAFREKQRSRCRAYQRRKAAERKAERIRRAA